MKRFKFHYWFSKKLNIKATQEFIANNLEEAIQLLINQNVDEKNIISIISWEVE